MSQIGKLVYRDEQFLGVQELSQAQELQKNSILSIVQKFGDRGLFNFSKEPNISLELVSQSLIRFNVSKPILLGYDGTNLIYSNISQSIAIPTSGLVYIGIEYVNNTFSEGIVSVSATGTVTGIGTKFTQLFRNSINRRVSKIKIGSNVYAIANVTSDTVLQLIGTSFEVVSNFSFSVIGTFSPYTPDIYSEDTIYLFDNYRLIGSSTPFNETTQFQIVKLEEGERIIGNLQFDQITILRMFGSSTVGTEDIIDGAVTTVKIADDAITNRKIGVSQVTDVNIARYTLTQGAYGNLSVRTNAIGSAAVTEEKIKDGAVTPLKLDPSILESRYTIMFCDIQFLIFSLTGDNNVDVLIRSQSDTSISFTVNARYVQSLKKLEFSVDYPTSVAPTYFQLATLGIPYDMNTLSIIDKIVSPTYWSNPRSGFIQFTQDPSIGSSSRVVVHLLFLINRAAGF